MVSKWLYPKCTQKSGFCLQFIFRFIIIIDVVSDLLLIYNILKPL